jgi:hypothetical protein
MRKLLICLPLFATLATMGCAVHKIDIQQGNVVTQEMIDRLKPGMTKRQVAFVLGTPPVVDVRIVGITCTCTGPGVASPYTSASPCGSRERN